MKELHHQLRLLVGRFYAEPHRYYHTMHHVEQVVGFIGLGKITKPELLAAHFHDAVYIPGFDGNEKASVALMMRYAVEPLGKAPNRKVRPVVDNFKGREIDEAGDLILETASHRGEHRFLDADLSILAAPMELYDAYAQGIEREYAHVEETDYWDGRTAFLKSMLERNRIFSIKYGGTMRNERRARENMERELWMLEGA